MDELNHVAARVLAVVSRGELHPLHDDAFAELARAVFALQYERNRPFRAYCDRRGATPANVGSWRDVPFVPTDAFRSVPLVSGTPADAAATFRTSGTTRGSAARGEHHLLRLDIYEAALAASFRAHLLPDDASVRVLSLVAPPEAAPDSSLSHMAGVVVRDLGAEGSAWLLGGDGPDVGALDRAVHDATAAAAPVLVFTTSYALLLWLDALTAAGATHALPAGSRVMDTGGFKGRTREVERGALYGAVHERLGVSPAWCVNEYGMTEMSSQFYDTVPGRGGARRYVPPPWVRSEVVDPETLLPLPAGETGVLRHYDLANVYSVAAIQTADLGRWTGDGFEVLGRATGAEARGCSLALEAVLGR